MTDVAKVSSRGARRWAAGHPWIFRSDVVLAPASGAGVVRVVTGPSRPLGWALWSPASEISLRLLDPDPDASIDGRWWRERIAAAGRRRSAIGREANAFRLVYGEADGCPSLIADRYDRWVVVQLLSAGVERFRAEIVDALLSVAAPDGILARHDVAARAREGLPQDVTVLHGSVPAEIEVMEHGVRYLAAPWTGQKTGAFLDQRENRLLAGRHTPEGGRALDCFSYHGSFALHLARRAAHVVALDTSDAALERVAANAALNALTNIETVAADAFEYLRKAERAETRFDLIVLDPPAFAKSRAALPAAVRGYKEINLRAMRLLSREGRLFTASCSHHLSRAHFVRMLHDAAADSGRRLVLRTLAGQPDDHPEVITIPETGYLKGALLQAVP